MNFFAIDAHRSWGRQADTHSVTLDGSHNDFDFTVRALNHNPFAGTPCKDQHGNPP
jgi:hypothetical protein